MQIYKHGKLIYNSIDNTGSTDDASLGAKYAMGRLNDIDNRFDNYVTKTEILDSLDENIVTKNDFVTEPTDKEIGIEFVLPTGPTESSPNDLNINDSDEMRHSTVHTSSNHYINTKLDNINNALVGKMSIEFVDELPTSPERNTQYYVKTEKEDVWDIYISDNVGTVRNAGTTELSMGGYVQNTTKVAGIALNADISAQQIEDATKSISSVFTNKTIDASNNTISNITTTNISSSSLATNISSSPVNTKLTTEKSIYDYAVQKTNTTNQIYGSSGNYALTTAIGSSSTDVQIPTAKSIYSYAVPKTTGANKIYGTNSNGDPYNFDRVTSVSSSSTDTQIPTAKAIYSYAVPQTSTGNRIYGTNSSGGETQYPFSDTYNSTATNQLFTRAGAYKLYSAVRNGEQDCVFCGNFTRNSTQSIASTSSVKVLLTGSDIYRTNLVQLASNGIKILVAGTYKFHFIGRLADTAGATRAWYLGGGVGSMADDQMGGQWLYTYFRHKGEATYLKYCEAGNIVHPWVYIDGNTGTLNYMTVEVFRLNNK